MLRILILEDVASEAELVQRELRRGGLTTDMVRVETRDEFILQLAQFTPDVILSDYSLPAFDGMTALSIAAHSYSHIPFVFVSGTIGEEMAIQALKCGAVDYVLKNNLQRLVPAVRRAVDEARSHAARIQAEQRFRDLIDYAPHALVVINQHGRIEIVNEETELLFGYTRSELLGTDSQLLVAGRFSGWYPAVFSQNTVASRRTGFEVIGRRRDGSTFPAEVSLSPLPTADGAWISSVIRDISERKMQQERLARMTRIRTILGSINSVILRVRDKHKLLDEACRIACEYGEFAGAMVALCDRTTQRLTPFSWAGIDPAFLQFFPVQVDDIQGADTQWEGYGLAGPALRGKRSVVSNDTRTDRRLTPWQGLLQQHGYRSILAVPLMMGEQPFGVLLLFATQQDAFTDDEQFLLSELAADISFSYDFIGKDEQLNYLAYFDALTGLPNRTLFQDRLGLLLAAGADGEQGPIAIVLIDIERFRHVNATFGRAAGDDLLRAVARRLRDCVPDAGYLARLGGDAFVFLLKGNRCETEVVHLIEGALTNVLAVPLPVQDNSIRLSARAGIALYPSDGSDSDGLLRNAEAALKDTKLAKVHYLFYTAEMNARTAEKLSLENRLRRALEEQQFLLHYQPKVALTSGDIVGMEALIRWQEPDEGLLSPLRFIQVLEDTGLIVEVGAWVIAQAHRQYQQWHAMGLVVPRIAVNVSQLQIRQKDFVTRVLRILDVRDATKASALELEITESLFIDDLERNVTRSKLMTLRESGLTIAIDDFGTGYSSLSYLARLPIDTLKIDRSFITGMNRNTDNMAIVSTIISLAHSLKLKVVAEGVETTDQRDQLLRLGCDQMQGFLYSPAVPAGHLARLLRQRGPGNLAGGPGNG